MLDVGLPVCAGGRQKHAVLPGENRREIFVDFGAPSAAFLHLCVAVARSLAGLDRLHRGRERDVTGKSMALWHRNISGDSGALKTPLLSPQRWLISKRTQ